MSEFPTVFPALRYRDPRAAIEFLEAAFGAERHAVYEDEGGKIQHAELRLGNGMVLLGTGDPTPGVVIYVVVEEPDTHCARAREAGSAIVREPVDTDYGAREYACRDPEGYTWSFGTYQPFAVAAPARSS
jgi:uncharacterized glyoxalase superfamily protein PhnB